MAHFAQLDNNNIVINVIVISNSELLDENNNESEQLGIAFCKSLYGENTNWVQTSYNGNFRKNYAVIGDFYDSNKDAFYGLTPSAPNYVFDEEKCEWIKPIPPKPNIPNEVLNYNDFTGEWEIVPRPAPSWVPNETWTAYLPPSPRPNDGKIYFWNEELLTWEVYADYDVE